MEECGLCVYFVMISLWLWFKIWIRGWCWFLLVDPFELCALVVDIGLRVVIYFAGLLILWFLFGLLWVCLR